MREIVVALLWSLTAAWGATAALAQGAQRLFQQRCGACHQIVTDRNGTGPHLQGVIGRAAGKVEGFNYSPSLRNSGLTWSAEALETFLANPTAMERGTHMTQRVKNADERRSIIEFLAHTERAHRPSIEYARSSRGFGGRIAVGPSRLWAKNAMTSPAVSGRKLCPWSIDASEFG
jgi:cytochrome c